MYTNSNNRKQYYFVHVQPAKVAPSFLLHPARDEPRRQDSRCDLSQSKRWRGISISYNTTKSIHIGALFFTHVASAGWAACQTDSLMVKFRKGTLPDSTIASNKDSRRTGDSVNLIQWRPIFNLATEASWKKDAIVCFLINCLACLWS